MRPTVFLDRDDTLNECRGLPAPPPPAAPGDLIDPALVRLLPGVLQACIDLRSAGFTLVVVTNQGTVARGGATVETVERVNRRLRELLTVNGRELIDAVYFCPYHPIGIVPEYTREHPWRKPAPGMILAATADMGLDLARSWMVGDAERDVECGIRAGIDSARCLRVGPEQRLAGLGAAARVILGTSTT